MEQQVETLEKVRKVPPKGTPEYREYNRDQKRKSRENKKREREAKEVITAWECFDQFLASPQYGKVRDYATEQHQKIAEELGFDQRTWSNHPAFYGVDMALFVSFGYEKDFVRRVVDPAGVMVSGTYFGDAVAAVIVDDSHKYRLVERSSTYGGIYRPLLMLLNKKFGHNSDSHALAIRQELAGTYQLESVT